MKKLLLATTIMSLATPALAEQQPELYPNSYIRADIGGNMFTSFNDKQTYLKLRSEKSMSIDIGGGSYLTDVIRAELVFSHHIDPELKKSGKDTNWGDEAQNLAAAATAATGRYIPSAHVEKLIQDNHTASSLHKADIDSLMAKVYVDAIKSNYGTIFVGAGVGVARLKETVSVKHNFTGIMADIVRSVGESPTSTTDYSTKRQNNFAYSLSAGVSQALNSQFTIEAQYTYSDFGKSASGKIFGNEYGKNHYRSHAIKLGFRLSI